MSRGAPGLQIRTAGAADLDRLTSLFTDAFREDPVWSWAFPDAGGMGAWWRFYIGSALRYPSVWVLGDFAAAAVWIPPGGEELTEAEEQRVEPLLRTLVGPRADEVLDLVQRFEDAHPRAEPHHYLSLLATAPQQRGHGLGMALLRDTLRHIDDDGAPAYLESTNPANDRRYEGVGFRRAGSFTTPDGRWETTTMWRTPRGSGPRSGPGPAA